MRQDTAWLVFDLGGVLFNANGAAGVAGLTGMSQDAAHDALVASPAVHALETGEIDAEAFGLQFAAELGVSISPAEMVELWASWEAGPKPGAVQLLTSLHEQQRIACLTNNNPIHWSRLCTLHGAHRLFHKCYVSHEIGLMKPDPRLFQHVVADLETQASDIVYFDDRLDIIEAARSFGLNAHQVTSPEQIRTVLEAN